MEQMKANLGRLGSFTERAVTLLKTLIILIGIKYSFNLVPMNNILYVLVNNVIHFVQMIHKRGHKLVKASFMSL